MATKLSASLSGMQWAAWGSLALLSAGAAGATMDPGCTIDPALGGKDPADVPAQRGFRLSAVLSGGDRAQPGVKARDACADEPA